MSQINIMHGNHTFKNGSSKVTIFAFPGGEERVFPSKVLKQVKGSYSRNPASSDGYEGHGVWYANAFESKEGLVLGIMLNVTFRGSPYASCLRLLRLRDDAPMIQVRANLSKHAEAVYDALPTFTGNADLITPKEARVFGVTFPSYTRRNFFDEEELEDEFLYREITPGTPKPKIVSMRTPDGKLRKVAVKPEPKRRMRVRR